MAKDEFIGLPPGIVPNPDSGTVRRSRSERAERGAEIVFRPAVPGVPPPPAAAPADDRTVVVARTPRAAAGWRLRMPDRPEPVPVDRATLLGRNPAAIDGIRDAALLPIEDPGRSVSKTHALLEPEETMLWVRDLDSTNGVRIVPPAAAPVEVRPGERVEVPPGAVLELGDYAIRVERG